MTEPDNSDLPDDLDVADDELEELQDVEVPLESDPADWQEQQLEVPVPDPDEER